MRNKLKRRTTLKPTQFKCKDQAQTTGVIVLSESSCTDDETSQESRSRAIREKRTILCKKGVQIAPIFISAIQHRKSKGSSDGSLGQRAGDKQKSAFIPQNDDVKSSPTSSHLTLRGGYAASACRGQLSASALLNCLAEIQTLNPAFSVQTIFSTLQEKASEESGSTECSLHPDSLQNYLKEKRKQGNEISAKLPNCLQTADASKVCCPLIIQDVQESSVFTLQKAARGSKLSYTHTLRQNSGRVAGLEDNCPESDTQLLKGSDSLLRDFCFEEVLWTDKYSPERSSEVIGNAASVNKLLSWLKKWKLRADCEERRETEERKREENDSWDCGDFQGEAGAENQGEGSLSNTMLITGPSGVGKTASVYACAQELGFKVFEVNSSSQRSGRHVLSQLKEATQSHLVEISGKDPLKPAYFSNYSCTPKSEALPGKVVRPKNVTSTLKKRPKRSLSCKGKAKPDMLTLAHYFKMKDKADQFHFGGMSPAVKPDGKELSSPSLDGDQTVQQSKRTATSLILFEEVDIIFEEDVGFLAAIKTFMTTTRRPVILTTSDPSFKERFGCSLEEIIFKTPSAVNVCSYLQLVCLAEKAWLDSDDVRSLFTLTCGDIRRCLLQLQLWVLSGEALPKETVCPQYSEAPEGNGLDSQLPEGQTCCSADMLGLHSVTPNHLMKILKCESWSKIDMDKLLNILSESWRRGVSLLYSNLELLLSLRAEGSSARYLDKKADPELHCEPRRPNSELHIQPKNQTISPKVSAACSKSARSRSRLSRKKFKAMVHDAQSASSLSNKIQSTLLSLNWTPLRAQSSSDTTKQKAARVGKDCIDALTDLFDLMSYLDATLPGTEPPVSGSCTPDSFVWTGAALKDGLLDEMSEDDGSNSSNSQEELMDIKAAVEGLGCHICFQRVSEAWTLTQPYTKELEDKRRQGLMDRTMMKVSPKRQRLSFTSPPLCASRPSKLSRTVLSSKYFSLLGNRQAVCVDFMPVLRFICCTLRAQQQKGELVRCVNFLSSLGLSNSAMKLLTEDFTQRKVWKDS
ncbi:ATPase family AAA domain-containing protein 5b isoform X2 [Melanotaenia boesemani]|uniref:ATPase family AAA domain-containing protein 5b isoform X2 n=1 Tax=Melanotaenia boesemani TaxID=1250792 RepID=UPI001C05AC03|nr:ATPase family AAA domain-containing protein 5b isoform X2 [Melanotaenia boesemani]